MKLTIKCKGFETTLTTTGELELEDCYNGIVVHTPRGAFGISQRDGGLEVLCDGKLVYSSEHNCAVIATPGTKAPPPINTDEMG